MSPCPSSSNTPAPVSDFPIQAAPPLNSSAADSAIADGKTFSKVFSQVDKQDKPSTPTDADDETKAKSDDKKPTEEQVAAALALLGQNVPVAPQPQTLPKPDGDDVDVACPTSSALGNTSVRQLLSQVPGTYASGHDASSSAAADVSTAPAASTPGTASAATAKSVAASSRFVSAFQKVAATTNSADPAGPASASAIATPASTADASVARPTVSDATKLAADTVASTATPTVKTVVADTKVAASSVDASAAPVPGTKPNATAAIPDPAATADAAANAQSQSATDAPSLAQSSDANANAVATATASDANATATGASPAPANAAANVTRSMNLVGRREVQEKFAEGSLRQSFAGDKTSGASAKNKSLTAAAQSFNDKSSGVGTSAANWGENMSFNLRNSAALPLAELSAAQLRSGSAAADTSDVSQANAVQVSHASDLVHEIRQIADGVASIERNSVEVKFKVGDNERLSVRVEYRDGTVHTTFKTDSDEMRSAIAAEWNNQGGSNSGNGSNSEQRAYKFADPIFNSPNHAGANAGGDSSRQQRSAEQSNSFERSLGFGSSRSAASTTTKSAPTTSATPQQQQPGRLHAIA